MSEAETTGLSALDQLIAANTEDSERHQGYSIHTRYPDDPSEQGRLAAVHALRIQREYERSETERAATEAMIALRERELEALQRRLAEMDAQRDERTRHDRMVLADWLRNAEHLQGARRKFVDIGAYRIGTRIAKAKDKIACEPDVLASLFPDLTEVKLVDKPTAMSRLRADGSSVVVVETGECVASATVAHVPETTTVYMEMGKQRITLETLVKGEVETNGEPEAAQ